MDEQYFTKPDTWTGGYYELALEIGVPSDERLFAALNMLWQYPTLEGCYLERDLELSDQKRISPSREFLHSGDHLLGLATLPNGKRTACGTFLVREENGSDWLDLYLPLGALSQVYKEVGGYPFGDFDMAHIWQDPMDQWLESVGRYVYQSAPFVLGIIGHEVSGFKYAKDFETKGIPEKRGVGYLWTADHKLDYFPRNQVSRGE